MSCASAPAPGNFAILPEHQARALVDQCSRAAPKIEGTWPMAAKDAAQLERDLHWVRRLRASECCMTGGRVRDIDRYLRQYVGVIVDGKQYVYINAVAASLGDDESLSSWKEVPVMFCDGGSASWGVLYDPRTRTFSQLAFNGVG